MKYINKSIKKLILPITLITIILFSCRKEAIQRNLGTDNLGFLTERIIKINQAVLIYDSTEITDSIDFVIPPTDKYYEWKVTPDNQCDSIVGSSNKGIVEFIFHCAGTYLVTANIFDSLTHNLIGNTDTAVVKVTTDTLYTAQHIYADDVLNMRPGIVKTWTAPHDPSNSPPDEIYIQLVLSTTKLYDYYTPYIQFDYTSNNNTSQYSYVFANAIRLNSYPFAFGYGVKDKVWGTIDLKGLTIGIPVTLSVTWLNITYTGTVTLTSWNQYSFSWNNTGGVIIN